MHKVKISTDGSFLKNPGGAGGCAGLLRFGTVERKWKMGFISTTNNRMEMMAVAKSLEMLTRPCEVEIVTDSMLIVFGIGRRNDRAKKKSRQNPDLWARIFKAMEGHNVTATWVKGHDGHPENTLCDRASDYAARNEAANVDSHTESLPELQLF